MCKCNPLIRTPFCGRPGCLSPEEEHLNKQASFTLPVSKYQNDPEFNRLVKCLLGLLKTQFMSVGDLEEAVRMTNFLHHTTRPRGQQIVTAPTTAKWRQMMRDELETQEALANPKQIKMPSDEFMQEYLGDLGDANAGPISETRASSTKQAAHES